MVNNDASLEKYSFSKLSSFHTCKYGFKLKYIDHLEGEGNCFSSYGLLMHSLLERYAKGEFEIWDLAGIFDWEFDTAIPEEFPPNEFCDLRKTYYEQGLEYLKNFQGYDKFDVLGVEEEFSIPIDDWLFNGIVDLIYIDEDGRLVICDHKSKAKFKSREEQKKYTRQLYLYAYFVHQKYGRYPDILKFNMFRKQNEVVVPFVKAEFDEAIEWARQTVKDIRACFDYKPTCESFFGNHLCNHREYCEYKAPPEQKKNTYNKYRKARGIR